MKLGRHGPKPFMTEKSVGQGTKDRPPKDAIGRHCSALWQSYEKIPAHERDEHDEGIDVTAVNVCPEDNQRNEQPDVEGILVDRKGQNQQIGGGEQIGEAGRPDVEERPTDEHGKTAGDRGQCRIDAQGTAGKVQTDDRQNVNPELPYDQGIEIRLLPPTPAPLSTCRRSGASANSS